jgi:hypothetical protein
MYLSGLMVKVNYVGRGSVSRQDSRARGGQEDTKERKGTEDGRLGQENGKGGWTGEKGRMTRYKRWTGGLEKVDRLLSPSPFNLVTGSDQSVLFW